MGLAAQALRDRLARIDGETAPLTSADLDSLVEGVRRTCRTPIVACAGLMSGRAGLLLTQRLLGAEVDTACHRERLAWHEVPLDRSLGRPHGNSATMQTGDGLIRLSADVATGSAGTLIALAPDPGEVAALVLRLPIPARAPGEPRRPQPETD